MIQCNINRKKRRVWVKAKGESQDVAVEALTCIKMIYQQIVKVDPEAAKGFKLTIIGCVLDPKSPVWEVDHGE